MKLKKLKIDWLRLIGGFLFFALGFIIILPQQIENIDLITLNLTANKLPINKSKSHKEFEIYCKDFKNTFVIDRTACVASHWEGIKDIKVGDSLGLKICSSRKSDLNKIDEEIGVFELTRNNKTIFTLEDYNKAENKLDFRKAIIAMLIGSLVTLRATKLISKSTGYKIGLSISGVVIVLILFDFI